MLYRPILLSLFFLSGAASLVYQVLWTRRLALAFGSGTLAVSAVLVAFMTGLALGAWILGRLADRTERPLRLYALLEGGIALSAVILPAAVEAIGLLNPILHGWSSGRPWLLPAARLVLSFSILLVPCTLIGGTLPVLVRFAVRSPEAFGRDFGLLYGMNTLGAVAGAVLAGFFLLGRFGLAATNWTAVGANLLLAASFLAIDSRVAPSPVAPAAPGKRPMDALALPERVVVAVAVLSGFTILALEVLWTRALVHALLSTTFSFTAVLAVILTALAAGSFLSASWRPVASAATPVALLGRLAVIELVFAAALLAELPAMGLLVPLSTFYTGLGIPGAPVLAKFMTAAMLLFVPAAIAGMIFPLSVGILRWRLEGVGGGLGRIYLWNTLAAAAGALAAGFCLIPALGVKVAYLGLAGVHAAVAVALGSFFSSRRLAWAAALPVFLGAAVIGGRALDRTDLFGDPTLDVPELEMELIDHEEATDATFAVYRNRIDDSRYLYINGFVAASAERASQYMPMMGHLPAVLHPDPKRALVIAFGTGSTAGALTLHPLERIDIVDITAEVYGLAHHFSATNHDVLKDRRTRTHVEDGRNFVEASRESWDIITSEPMPPKFAGMVNLYSREYFEAVRDRLSPDGIFCHWLPFHLVTEEDSRMIAATLLEVFPETALWVIRGTGLLVGSKVPLKVTAEDLAGRLGRPGLRERLEKLELGSAPALLRTYALDSEGLRRLAAGRPAITDDRPSIEFSSDQPYRIESYELPIYDEIRSLRRECPPTMAAR